MNSLYHHCCVINITSVLHFRVGNVTMNIVQWTLNNLATTWQWMLNSEQLTVIRNNGVNAPIKN